MLTLQKIKEAKPQTRKVETPEWGEGEYVYVRKLSGALLTRAQELIEKHNTKPGPESNGEALTDMRFLCEMWAVVVSTKDGQPMAEAGEVDALLDCDWEVIDRCVEEGLDFNNLTEESMARVRDNLKKNRRKKPG